MAQLVSNISKNLGATAQAIRMNENSQKTSNLVQNFRLVWLDGNINKSNPDCRNTLTRLKRAVNSTDTFTNISEFLNFIPNINEDKLFLIVSGSLGLEVIPKIHGIPQIEAIFIFCSNKTRYESMMKEWFKIKGIFTHIGDICESLNRTAYQCDQDLMPMSFLSAQSASSTSADHVLNKLDQTFMYTQLFKEILLEISHEDDQRSIETLVKYCHEKFADNQDELKKVDLLEKEYKGHCPIWWYTCESFIYRMVNRALCKRDVEIIIKMGFFIRDLHQDIVELHAKQLKNYKQKTLTVYRGQRFTKENFDSLLKMKDGLISFNNFLSTSLDENVSIDFARRKKEKPDSILILFKMLIDLSQPTAPFAQIDQISYFASEKEVLFSTHTVFRVGDIVQVSGEQTYWAVNLTLTNQTNAQLNLLAEKTRAEISNSKGWLRLNELLIKLGELQQAEYLTKMLISTNKPNQTDHSVLSHQYAQILRGQGKYDEAVTFYNESNQ